MRSCSSLALTLRLKVELAAEELRSSLSLKLKSVLSLARLPSLSNVALLPRESSWSISTVIIGGAACLEFEGVLATSAAVLGAG